MLAFALILLVIVWRIAVAIAPPALKVFDFTPMLAVLLFFGARIQRKWMWLAALALLGGTDVFLSLFVYRYPLTGDLVVSLAWYAAILWFGNAVLAKKQSALRIAGAALAGSLSFFLISNFGAWLSMSIYPKTPAGLLAAYVAGIPFYQNRFAADMIFTAALFGLPALAKSLEAKRAAREISAA
jgi:hypothetical protein